MSIKEIIVRDEDGTETKFCHTSEATEDTTEVEAAAAPASEAAPEVAPVAK